MYVGLYGLSYIEAGREVLNLFKAKGWTTIITNDLTTYVTLFSVIFVGFINGFVALLLNGMGLSVGLETSALAVYG